MIYKAGKRIGVENDKFIHFNVSPGTYLIEDFNTKIKVAIVQQIQDWQPPQIKDLQLVIPENYTFIAANNFFIVLGIPNHYLEKTILIRSRLFPGSYKTSFDTSPPPISLSLHCRQISKVKNELDGQPSSLLARMYVSNYKATLVSNPLSLFRIRHRSTSPRFQNT